MCTLLTRARAVQFLPAILVAKFIDRAGMRDNFFASQAGSMALRVKFATQDGETIDAVQLMPPSNLADSPWVTRRGFSPLGGLGCTQD